LGKERHEVRIISPGFSCAWKFHLTHAESLCLHVEVGFSVDVGRVDGDVTEPGADRIDIDACAEQVSCGRMPPMPGPE
jgi:hypothetical protein